MIYDRHLKTILLGNVGLGKSSILSRLIYDTFSRSYSLLISCDFYRFLSSDGKTRFQLWNTVGKERFKSISAPFYRNIAILILVFDVNDKAGLDSVADWLYTFRDRVFIRKCADISDWN